MHVLNDLLEFQSPEFVWILISWLLENNLKYIFSCIVETLTFPIIELHMYVCVCVLLSNFSHLSFDFKNAPVTFIDSVTLL